ncbi:MAG TPA: hypothetical protein VGE52_00915, partial [Pirellulales bacterium]
MDARRIVCAAIAFLALGCVAHAADATPHWIWFSKDNSIDVFYARHTFELPAGVKSAMLAVAADNHATAYINGKEVLRNDVWQEPTRADVSKQLAQGKNVLAIQTKDDDSQGGLIALLNIELTDGKKLQIATGPEWLVADKQADGWRDVAFDAKGWAKAYSLGALGVAPWNAIALDPSVVPKAQATVVENITTLPGFEAELLYSVPKSVQGSWVSLTNDPKGRLIVSDQSGSLYRITPPPYPSNGKEATVEKLEL